MDEDMALDEQAQSLDDEDIGSAHIPKVNLRQDWWKPLEEERPVTPEPAWSIPLSNLTVLTNNWASALATNYSPPPEDSLLAQTGDIATLWTGSARDEELLSLNLKTWKALYLKSSKSFILIPALSITKMKAAYYPDAGLEQMVPDQFWIEEECKYDIAAITVRTHMQILSVVRIEVFSMYGYDYMKKIVLRHVDLNEHVIVEQDFKYLYPSDFEDLYLLNLQGHLNHLSPKDKKILTTAGQGVQDQHDESRFKYEVLNQKDVDRSKAFMFAIQKRLKTRRIFCNMESFVGRRVREGDYRLLKRTE
nr:hypothetical protein [Tanacetum cinerariifolium]